ncbi:MAG TPA: hypothetical protein VGL46_13495 [Pseudonocardiaceae bacterium]
MSVPGDQLATAAWCGPSVAAESGKQAVLLIHGSGSAVYAARFAYQRSGRKSAIIGHSQGALMAVWIAKFWPEVADHATDVIGLFRSDERQPALEHVVRSRVLCAAGVAGRDGVAHHCRRDQRTVACYRLLGAAPIVNSVAAVAAGLLDPARWVNTGPALPEYARPYGEPSGRLGSPGVRHVSDPEGVR